MRATCFLLIGVCGLLFGAAPVVAQSWVQSSAPSKGWTSIACSADGSCSVALSGDGIYVSTNAGSTWLQTTNLNTVWLSVAASADGTKMVALGFQGIYLSTNSGFSWVMVTNPPVYWGQVACSGDGAKWIAVGGYNAGPRSSIYLSTDSGSTWFTNSLTWQGGWIGAASSADGTRFAVAAANGGPVFNSTNAGLNWTSNNSPSQFWHQISGSCDLSRVIAVHTHAFVRDNTGFWTETTVSVPGSFWNAASSADGNRMVIAPYPGYPGAIFTSTDSGLTWSSNSIPVSQFQGVAISADGSRMFAGGYPGGIYTLQTQVQPKLNVARSGSDLKLSWTIPATTFVLQQSSDLGTNWSVVTNTPVMNFTNIQNEVVVSPTNSICFYRLAVP